MTTLRSILFATMFIFAFASCTTTPSNLGDDLRIHVTLLHFNDIYEITPVSGGVEGGIARVATLRNQLLKRNPNTITTLGGDLFSPSAIGTAKYKGERLAGRQMVDVLNEFGLDYATFGNHEFDIKEGQFRQRLSETKFTWVSSNVFNVDGKPFEGVKQNFIIPIVDPKSGATFKLGMFGITLPVNKSNYVRYTDPLTTAGEQIKKLDDQSDFIIGLTHQSIKEDVSLLKKYPQVGLLLGGHEHENFQRWRGNFAPILKGDANVRSVYIIDLYYDPETGKTEVEPAFVPITNQLNENPKVKRAVDKWKDIAFKSFRDQGFEPEKVVTTTTVALNGLESDVRFKQTNLTELIARSMLRPYNEAELSVYNSGSIRIDDIIPEGRITVYDVIRTLPFGGKIQLGSIKGSLLEKVLNQGIKNMGSGGYLQSAKTKYTNGIWYISGTPIDPQKTYKIAINDFLASGREQGLDYLKPDNSDFSIINSGNIYDIRKSVIEELRNLEGLDQNISRK